MAVVSRRAAAIMIFAVVTALIAYQVYVSLSFGLILKPLSADLGLEISLAGAISAAFMLAIAAIELPAGVALDRLPPGKVLAAATFVCALGAALLAISDSVAFAVFSRLVMGAGAAFAFVGALKVLSMIVSGSRFALVVGLWQVFYSPVVAGLAASTAAAGLETQWRLLMFLVAGAGVVVAILLWCINALLPDRGAAGSSPASSHSGLKSVLRNRQVLLASAFFGCTYGPMLAYTDLWAVSNELAWGNSPEVAAGMAGMLPIGMGVGSLIVGALTDFLRRPRLIGGTFATIGLIVTVMLFFGPGVPASVAFLLTFLFGVGCSAAVVALDHARAFAPFATGTAIGLVSSIGYLATTILQGLIGLLVEARSVPGQPTTGSEYSISLAPIPICFALAIFIAFLMSPRPKADD